MQGWLYGYEVYKLLASWISQDPTRLLCSAGPALHEKTLQDRYFSHLEGTISAVGRSLG